MVLAPFATLLLFFGLKNGRIQKEYRLTFKRESTTTVAEVIQKTSKSGTPTSDGATPTTYFVTVQFKANGEPYRLSASIKKRLYKKLQKTGSFGQNNRFRT